MPFKEWPAFEAGIIDANGEKLKKPETSEERKHWTLLDRFVYKLKLIMQRFVGKSRMAAMLTTAYLIKESYSSILKDLGPEVLQEAEKLLKEWNHTKNFEFYSSIKGIPIPDEKRFFMVESNPEKFEIALYKYFKGVESFLEGDRAKAIERLLK